MLGDRREVKELKEICPNEEECIGKQLLFFT